MLLPLAGTTLTILAALWLLRISAPRAGRPAPSAKAPALGTGLALALPMIAVATQWQWLGNPPETRLALIAVAALPIAVAMSAMSAALLSAARHRHANPPRWLPAGAIVIAVALLIIAASESAGLVDVQALGLLAIVWWWWSTLRGTADTDARNTPNDRDTASPPASPPTSSPGESLAGPHRGQLLGAVALGTLAGCFAAGDQWLAIGALIVWSLAATWFLRPMIANSHWAPPIGLAACGPALGVGWLGIVESLRLVNAVHREALAIGIEPNWLERIYFAAEALGTAPTLTDTALLAAPAAALAALALFLLLIRRPETREPPTPTPWRAGAVAGVWLVVALALVLAPVVLVFG